MTSAFSRSWDLTKITFSVIGKDKEMLLFPILAGAFSLLFIAAQLVPTLLVVVVGGLGLDRLGALQWGLLFIVYFGLAFIATFFNVCVVYTAKTRFEGKNAAFMDSIRFAFSRIHLIFTWSLVSATVGLLLRIIDRLAQRSGPIGRMVFSIISGILGIAWSIATLFVIPAMVYKGLGPIDALKVSVNTFKKTWGESIIRYIGFGFAQLMFFAIGIILAIPIFLLSLSAGVIGIVAAIFIIIVYFVFVAMLFGVATAVFNTALYTYAATGKIPHGYSKEILQNSFKRKDAKMKGIV